jgi:hypothetical protein
MKGIKLTQAAARYQDHPKENQSCGNCPYFVFPNGCVVVEGEKDTHARAAILISFEFPAGSALREHWLVVVLWILLSQDACEDSHADFRIIAEGFYQNDRRCRSRHLWARRGC